VGKATQPDPWVQERLYDVGQQTGEHDGRPGEQRQRLHELVIALLHGVEQQRADSRDLKHLLQDQRAPDEEADVHREDRQRVHQCVAQGVTSDDSDLSQASRPRGVDVVGLQHLEQARAQSPHHDRGERQAERQRRQGQCPQDPTDPTLVARDGKPLELQAENQRQHQPEPEGRHRERERRPQPQRVVEDAVGTQRCQDRQRDADQERQHHGIDDEGRARPDALPDHLANRGVEGERLTEVALQRVRDVQPELGQQRPIEIQLMADLSDGRRGGMASQDDPHRVAGDEVNDEERGDEQAEQHHQGQRDTADQIDRHTGLPLVASAFTRSFSSPSSMRTTCPRGDQTRGRRCRCHRSSPCGR
jgi:hypothetical protein